MKAIKIDNCEYCNCITLISIPDNMPIEKGIEDGKIACWNCAEDGDNHSEFDVFNDNGKLIWCGHGPERCPESRSP